MPTAICLSICSTQLIYNLDISALNIATLPILLNILLVQYPNNQVSSPTYLYPLITHHIHQIKINVSMMLNLCLFTIWRL